MLPTLRANKFLPFVCLFLGAILLNRAVALAQPAVNGFPPVELLVSDIPFYSDGCCGRLDTRAQFVVTPNDLIWMEGSETPIRRMSKSSGEITTIAKWTGSPLNAVVRGAYIYWIESGIDYNTVRLNRTTLDGLLTSRLDEGPRNSIYSRNVDIVVTDSDVYWVNTPNTPNCTEAYCIPGDLYAVIRKVPLNGTSPTNFVTANVSTEIVSMATDGTHLYWQENGEYMGSSRIARIPLGGGQPIQIVDGSLNGRAQDWEPAGVIVIGGSELFFAGNLYSLGYNIMKVPTSGGAVAILAASLGSFEAIPRRLSVDETSVYWVDQETINSVPRHGGTASVLANGIGFPVALTVSGGRAFWAEAYCCGGGSFTGGIKSIAVGGGAITSHLTGLDGMRSLAIADNTFYFIEGTHIVPENDGGRIAKMPIAGGTVTTIVTDVMADSLTPMAVAGGNVYFADVNGLKKVSLQGGIVERLASPSQTDTVYALAADAEFVYSLSRRRGPIVRRIPAVGGPIEDVSLPGTAFRHSSARLILHDGFFYWVERSYNNPPTDAIMKASVAGGHSIEIASGMPPLGDISVAGNNVYFVEAGYPNLLRKMSVDGGSITTLTGVNDATTLAADSAGVYFVNFFDLAMVGAAGENRRALAANVGGIALALDAGGIYWMDYEGSILKIDRGTMDSFVNMISPHLGDIWSIRSRRMIQWSHAGVGNKVTISLSRDGGMTWKTLARNKSNGGSFSWKVTKPASSQAVIRICGTTAPTICDTSDGFIIQ